MKFVVLFLSISCVLTSFQNLPKREQIAYRLMQDFAKDMHRQDIHAAGFGLVGDKSNNKLGELDICFHYDNFLTIEIARELAVQITNRFIEHVNNNKELASHMTKFPITPQQVSLTISRHCSKDRNELRSVMLIKGDLVYFTNEPSNRGPVFTETYEEASTKLNHSNVT